MGADHSREPMTTSLASEAAETAGSSPRRQVGAWLILCAVLVFAMTLLGGVTRLTHSGLSIVEWEPLAGALPPLTEQAWQAEFAHYQQYPEYQKVNQGMNLAGFKAIYWFEYSHRLLGRAIGLIVAIGLVYFVAARKVTLALAWRLGILLIFGGLQGALGWYMVQSGLVDRPDVSHYRLTAHLGLAVAMFGYIVWLALAVLFPIQAVWGERTPGPFRLAAYVAVGLVYVLVLTGGLVAGLDAGFAYNTFPLMEGRWIPEGLVNAHPFDTIVSVQFLHRWYGVVVAAFLLLLWGRALDLALPRSARIAFNALAVLVLAQGALGLATLLGVVPTAIAAAHQGGALIVLTSTVAAAYFARQAKLRPPPGITVLP